MAFTCRLRPEIHAAAQAEAERMGISLMALVSVAVRAYLDRPPTPISDVQSALPASGLVSSTPVTSALRAPKRPRSACPCGSQLQWRHCHGKAG